MKLITANSWTDPSPGYSDTNIINTCTVQFLSRNILNVWCFLSRKQRSAVFVDVFQFEWLRSNFRCTFFLNWFKTLTNIHIDIDIHIHIFKFLILFFILTLSPKLIESIADHFVILRLLLSNSLKYIVRVCGANCNHTRKTWARWRFGMNSTSMLIWLSNSFKACFHPQDTKQLWFWNK